MRKLKRRQTQGGNIGNSENTKRLNLRYFLALPLLPPRSVQLKFCKSIINIWGNHRSETYLFFELLNETKKILLNLEEIIGKCTSGGPFGFRLVFGLNSTTMETLNLYALQYCFL